MRAICSASGIVSAPAGIGTGDVMFEEPRQVQVKDGGFRDWFGPFDVHVYRFRR